MSFDVAIEHVLRLEGGYVDDPADSGGKTNYGITERVARSFGYRGHMRDLPLEKAKEIYKALYWDELRLDDVDHISTEVAHELFDTAINMGVSRAGKYLQKALLVLTNIPLAIDGIVGGQTINALQAFVQRRGSNGTAVLFKALNCMQGADYIDLAYRRPKDRRFIYGWLKNRVAV